jgi:hypothetical protein
VTLSFPLPRVHAPSLEALEEVFAAWPTILTDYANTVPGDLPWWYNETAAVGFLGAAAWRAGGVAIVEFDNDRREAGASYTFRGRCDLYLKLNGAAYYAEAKQTFHWLGDGPDHAEAIADIRRKLDEATAQAEALQREPDAGLLALVFASPRLEATHSDRLDTLLEHWRSAVQTIDCDAVFTHFYRLGERPLADEQGNLYPGIALFVREVCPCRI